MRSSHTPCPLFQKLRFAKNIVSTLFNTVSGKRIALFGFAFKKDTGDTRETAAAYIAKTLLEERAKVVVYDPKVKEENMFMELDYTCGINEKTVPNLRSLITLVSGKRGITHIHAHARTPHTAHKMPRSQRPC